MTTSNILSRFELYLDDTSELSSNEELDLANKIYYKVCSERPWEFLKKQASGTIGTDTVGSYITLPTDFFYFATKEENNFIIFVGTDYKEYKVVPFSDRRQYRNQQGYSYLDLANSKIYFTLAPVDTTYEFDYIKVPAALTIATSPAFPEQFHDIIYHGMAVDGYVIQLFDKARSYAKENQAMYDDYLARMEYYNTKLII